MAAQGVVVRKVINKNRVVMKCNLAVNQTANASYPSTSGIGCEGVENHVFKLKCTTGTVTLTPQFYDGEDWVSGTPINMTDGDVFNERYPGYPCEAVRITSSAQSSLGRMDVSWRGMI